MSFSVLWIFFSLATNALIKSIPTFIKNSYRILPFIREFLAKISSFILIN
jgi:hypothetical protein